jgi:hypothetical protein
MTSERTRQIVTHAFVMTGKDHVPGYLEYIDRLEKALLQADKMHRRAKRKESLKHVALVVERYEF